VNLKDARCNNKDNRNNIARRYGTIKLYKPKSENIQTAKQLNPSKSNWIIIN